MTRAMTQAWLAGAIALAAVQPAAADPVAVKVIEVAGGIAYLNAGRTAGVVRGTKVTFARGDVAVIEVTETTSAVELGVVVLGVGATGRAEVTPGAAAQVRTLAKPRAPEAFAGQWPDLVVPAAAQQPKLVPLGSARATGRAHVSVIGHGFGAADRGGVDGQVEARVIASYDLMTERPLAVDADVAVRGFTRGANSAARVPVFVRAAQVRYGDPYDPRFALGRLRYAAASLGMLDGARASLRFGRLELGAFGGLVPDPINGKPDTAASRFGGEAAYDDPTAPWRPRVAATAYGSTWEGALDERRLTVSASASRAALWLDGWAEAQSFGSNNPWGARAIELTGAGATAQWRRRGMHLGADVTFLRPERSLRLAAALPREWLCTTRAQPGDVADEACTGGDSWTSGSLSAGARGEHWAVDAVGAIGRTRGIATSYDSSGYVSGELRLGPRRILLGVSGGRASFAHWIAGQLGLGVALSEKLDVAARYRPELIDYIASTEPGLLHSVVADVHYAMSPALDLSVSAIGSTGVDRDAAALLTTIAWRPLR